MTKPLISSLSQTILGAVREAAVLQRETSAPRPAERLLPSPSLAAPSPATQPPATQPPATPAPPTPSPATPSPAAGRVGQAVRTAPATVAVAEPAAPRTAPDQPAAVVAMVAELDGLTAEAPKRVHFHGLDLAAVDGSEAEVEHTGERSYRF